MPCRTCGSPLAADQRYCLECGDRNGPTRLDWRARVLAQPAVVEAVEQDDGVGPGLPSPRVAAGLVLGVLAFGVAMGNAATPDRADAGGRPPWTLVAQAAAAAAAPAAAAPVVAEDTTPAEPDTSGDVADLDDTASTDDGSSADVAAGDDATTTTDESATSDDSTSTDTTDSTGEDDSTDNPSTDTAAATHPAVKHVWVVALTGHSFPDTFGEASPAPYLAQELRAKGTLLPWYHAAGHDPAASGVALLGGQKDKTGPFDDQTPTLADQLSSLGQSWRAYVEGGTTGVAPGDNPCAVDPTTQPRNPFLRFGTITAGRDCQLVEPTQLTQDVEDAASAPAFSYILPAAAHDGSASLADADAWLKTVVPTILKSKAYGDGGLVVITFDQGAADDAEAGGGRVGALLLSPFVTAGGTVNAPYDPFSLLNSIQDLFGLSPRLGFGADTKLKPFGPKVYAEWSASSDGAENGDS
ncbi:alkaline phosphatase family protein [Baekduia sp. Peel2402]|uniref:alkaline phosphatase family protein n=1 Tax=Baekduia sp. Peel2402 TaxID=3458296 RepID=UPI00403EF551